MIKKHIFRFLLALTGKYSMDQFTEIERINNPEGLENLEKKYLEKLLLHAYHNIPFYSELLEKFGVVRKNEADLNRFDTFPLLTKDIIRNHRRGLTSKDIDKRKWYYNSSGGSTGEPVRLIQDHSFDKWMNATLRLYYENMVGIDELGAKKVLLWGSERDILEGTVGLKEKVSNWLTNTVFLNSFKMTERDMERYVKIVNSYKPDLIRGYAGSLYEFCKFVEGRKLSIHSPRIVVSSAENLRDEMRIKIEQVFATRVYNFYGSREVGAIAGECRYGSLHIFMFNNYTEVTDKVGMPVGENTEGRIIVTNLHNYSMPLIRYNIGDMAVSGSEKCKCGNPLPTLKKITGRITDHFVREDGTIIYGEYFTHLFYLKDWVKAFQIVQEDYKKVRVFVVLFRNHVDKFEKREIENGIKSVMGQDCVVVWEIVEQMPETQSGKRLYTTSLVHPD
jgi:phenylacetate-CoA ligase